MEPWRFRSGSDRCAEYFRNAGFAIVEDVIRAADADKLVVSLSEAVGPGGYAKRNLLTSVPEVAELACSTAIMNLVQPVLGSAAFPVKGILFDKTPDANWKVAWHQDNMISVRERVDTPGFGPWSVKEGVVHVQPPSAVLAGMITVRMHLDDCGPDNGPLRVIPGSHKHGLFSSDAIDDWRDNHPAEICSVRRGGVLLMRPLTLHASSSATVAGHRRVIHLEYAASPLTNGLHWANC